MSENPTPIAIIWDFKEHLDEFRKRLAILATSVISLKSYIQQYILLIPVIYLNMPPLLLPPTNPPFNETQRQRAVTFAKATRETMIERLEEYRERMREVCRGFKILKAGYGGEGADEGVLKGVGKIDGVIDELVEFFVEIEDEIAELPLLE